MASSSLPVWVKKLALVVFLLVILPATLTLLHLRHQIQCTGSCFVSGDTLTAGLYVYNGSFYSRIPLRKPFGTGWPSISRVATLLATPQSSLLLHGTSMDTTMEEAEIIHRENRWCLQSNGNVIACSNEQDKLLPPSSGLWTGAVNGKEHGTTSIEVSCPGSSSSSTWFSFLPSFSTSSSSLLEGIRKNPNKVSGQTNRNVEWVVLHPATTLLMGLNIGLALLYWNYHVDPSKVAKIYSNIIQQNELWRSFSGATAHFDALHIGFNMMSLYTLGSELEQSFGSIPFFLFNISLIPITTIFMMAMVYGRIKYTGNTQLFAETSTVGYSGVLFAWMVVTSLERSQTCPIPIMPDTCFETYEKFGFKFNASPLIQLVVAQFIMKRVSFVGHLAGIVAGFLLHWNLLPLEYIQPSMILPSILLVSYHHRKLIPVRNDNMQEEEEMVSLRQHNTNLNPRQAKRDREGQVYTVLSRLRNAMVAMLVLGVMAFGIFTSNTLSYGLMLALFWFVVQSHQLYVHCNDARAKSQETQRLTALLKGFVVVNIVLMITDSMTFAGWIISRVFFMGGAWCPLWCAVAVLIMRIALQFAVLVLSVKVLADTNQIGGGIFTIVFGRTILEPCKVVSTTISAALAKRKQQAAFEGGGVTLGSGPSTQVDESTSNDGQQLSHVL